MKTKILIPLAGLALFCACSAHKQPGADRTDTVSNAEPGRDSAIVVKKNLTALTNELKEVKTANMRFQVKDVQQTTEKITVLTGSFKGAVMHHWMTSVPVDSIDVNRGTDSVLRVTTINSTAGMIIKVPPANVEPFMNRVAALSAYVKSSKMDVTDKTVDYLSTKLKLKNQAGLVKQEKQGNISAKTPEDMLAFKNNMVDEEMSNMRTDDSVKMSVIQLSFFEDNAVSKKIIANSNLSAYGLSFGKRLAISFENGWDGLAAVLAALANFWALIPVGALVWWIVRYNKKKTLTTTIKSE